jgi:UDP-glucose 6-dehydrogenase
MKITFIGNGYVSLVTGVYLADVVRDVFLDLDSLSTWVDFQPNTSIHVRVENFVECYKKYNGT